MVGTDLKSSLYTMMMTTSTASNHLGPDHEFPEGFSGLSHQKQEPEKDFHYFKIFHKNLLNYFS